MKTAFIFHGTGGYPEENWFPWMKKELEKIGYSVFVPQFPTPNNQTPENWFKALDNYKNKINNETVLIGHSLGGAFLLRVLENLKVKVKLSCIVAAPAGILPIKNYEGDKPFISKPFDWAKIRKNSGKFVIFHSDNDPYVCLGNGKKLAKKLGSKLNVVPDAGHFNKAAGYTKFPELLKKIKENI